MGIPAASALRSFFFVPGFASQATLGWQKREDLQREFRPFILLYMSVEYMNKSVNAKKTFIHVVKSWFSQANFYLFLSFLLSTYLVVSPSHVTAKLFAFSYILTTVGSDLESSYVAAVLLGDVVSCGRHHQPAYPPEWVWRPTQQSPYWCSCLAVPQKLAWHMAHIAQAFNRLGLWALMDFLVALQL